MEIEKKYLIKSLPHSLTELKMDTIAQGYISTSPVIRIREKSGYFYLTCKSKGFMAREEFEIEITEEEFNHLKEKVDHHMVYKNRYYIPFGHLTIELDIFKDHLKGLIIAEVEFSSIDEALSFTPPDWFGEDVTEDHKYHNSYLSQIDAL